MQALGKPLHKILKPLAVKHGFIDARIFSQWASIIGAENAKILRPQKLSAGVLTLCAAHSSAALEAQHQTALLKERVNRYFGYCAVRAVRVIQAGFWQQVEVSPPPPQPDRGAIVRAHARLKYVKDAEVKQALARLGAFIEMQYSHPTPKQ